MYPPPHHPHDYSYAGYPSSPAYGTPAVPQPDPKTLEIFRKNWEYYSRNPQEMENLRISNPSQHENLMRYYQMFCHLLPTLSANEPARPSSRANSVKGGLSNSNSFHKIEESTIMHPEDQSQNNFQPTPEVSKVQEEDLEVEAISYHQEESLHPDLVSNSAKAEISVKRLTPVKFSTPHVNGFFSATNGRFLKIPAKSPQDGQTATLEFHSVKSLMSRQPGFKELHSFPGRFDKKIGIFFFVNLIFVIFQDH